MSSYAVNGIISNKSVLNFQKNMSLSNLIGDQAQEAAIIHNKVEEQATTGSISDEIVFSKLRQKLLCATLGMSSEEFKTYIDEYNKMVQEKGDLLGSSEAYKLAMYRNTYRGHMRGLKKESNDLKLDYISNAENFVTLGAGALASLTGKTVLEGALIGAGVGALIKSAISVTRLIYNTIKHVRSRKGKKADGNTKKLAYEEELHKFVNKVDIVLDELQKDKKYILESTKDLSNEKQVNDFIKEYSTSLKAKVKQRGVIIGEINPFENLDKVEESVGD